MDKRKAIICDLDGTLALTGNRDTYNPETVEDDLLNEPIAHILHVYSQQTEFPVQLILITGRFEKYREQTDRWLAKYGINYYILFMRRDTDFRKDIILKKEIYKRHIKDKYDVLFVLEDRDQVVRMWRKSLGLTCLQVEYGDF
jgi:hypothetical protein